MRMAIDHESAASDPMLFRFGAIAGKECSIKTIYTHTCVLCEQSADEMRWRGNKLIDK